jgi:hypothetical protein
MENYKEQLAKTDKLIFFGLGFVASSITTIIILFIIT